MGIKRREIADRYPHLIRLRPLIAGAVEVSEERKPPGELSGEVELSRVTFRYLPGTARLDGVTLKITQGEYVAIVGPSGSGECSLFRLLLGFERPEFRNCVLRWKGDRYARYQRGAPAAWRGAAKRKAGDRKHLRQYLRRGPAAAEQAWEAARLAGLEGDIRQMPMGMHTVVAEGMNTLSGGQRQRIMIARAVARRPRILLFDEATSALDNQTQAIVSASLGALNVTRIIIAHRLSTVRQADRIIMLVDGKIMPNRKLCRTCRRTRDVRILRSAAIALTWCRTKGA